jgi:coenzyme F420-0:L-glutamate ligase / coenzyme F420-1:gamma-L-glutamate ligase
MTGIQILPLRGLPEIACGADLVPLIVAACRREALKMQAGDILVVAQKIVSKAEGRVVALASIEPSPRAREFADSFGKDARVVELVLRESKVVLRMERGIIISETRHGYVCANAGVDQSNAAEGTAILLPEAPDASAQRLRDALSAAWGVELGVIISDTFGRAWREGLVNVALGVAGCPALIDYRGKCDAAGRPLTATVIAVADEIAAAAELVMGKADHVPAVLVRGVTLDATPGSGRDLLRPPENDLFR